MANESYDLFDNKKQKTSELFAQVEVSRTDLIREMKKMVRLIKPKSAGEVLISYSEGHLYFSIGGAEVSVLGDGKWMGIARLAGSFVLATAKVPPEDDPVLIQVKGSRLHIGSMSYQCTWQLALETSADLLPMNPSFIEKVALPLLHTPEASEAAGLSAVVETAQKRRKAIVAKVAPQLKLFGITVSDINQLIDEVLRR